MTALFVSDHLNGYLPEYFRKAISAATQLDSDLHVLLVGENSAEAASRAALIAGIGKVFFVQGESLAHRLPEPLTELLAGLAPSYSAILAAHSGFGKNILPRLAAHLDVGQVSGCVRIINPTIFERTIYAGNALETVELLSSPKILTIEPTGFEAMEDKKLPASVEELVWNRSCSLSSFVQNIASESTGIDLSSAKTVIAFGRALGTRDDVDHLIRPLAKLLNAGIGATRSAVDDGLAPNDWQIGQTGKIIAPDLYIGIGLSGAIQHQAGIRQARVIVAINQDETAPIFSLADYALAGDLFEIVPELIQQLQDRTQN